MNRTVKDIPLGRTLIFGISAGVLLAICSATGQAQNSPPSGANAAAAGNVENGKKVYNTVGCWMCHGYSGQGGTGARIAPDPLPLAAFIRYVRTPRAQMPPYKDRVLKDSELTDIYAYLKTMPKLPEAASIPLLSGTN